MRIAILMFTLCGMTLGVWGQPPTVDDFFPGGPDTVKICGIDTLFLASNVNHPNPSGVFYQWTLLSTNEVLLEAQGASSIKIPRDSFTNAFTDTIRLRVGVALGNYNDNELLYVRRNDGTGIPPNPLPLDDFFCTGDVIGGDDDINASSGTVSTYGASNLYWSINLGSTGSFLYNGSGADNMLSQSQLPATLLLTGISSNGCIRTSSSPGTVEAQAVEQPVGTNQDYCQFSTATVLNATVSDQTLTLTWFNQGATTPLSPTFTPSTAAFDTLVFEVESSKNGCTSTRGTATVRIFEKPGSTLSIAPGTTVCEGDTISFQAATPSGGSGFAYSWTKDSNPQVITGANFTLNGVFPSNGGVYQVNVGNSDLLSCATLSNPITLTVNPKPVISFTISPPDKVCLGDTPFALPTVNGIPINNQVWTSNPPPNLITGARGFNPSIFGVGNANLELEVVDANGCRNTTTAVILVQYQANDDLQASALAICAGESVTLTADDNPLISGYKWFRDNNEIAGQTNNTLIVTDPGVYFAEIDGQDTCVTITQSRTITVNQLPVIDFAADPPSEVCLNDPPFDLPLLDPTGLDTQDWSSNPDQINGQRGFAPLNFGTGTADITFTVVDDFGCESEEDFQIVVNDTPDVDFDVDADVICLRDVSTFTNNTAGADTYAWDFGDNNTSSDEDPDHTFTNPGTYNVVLIATNNTTTCDATSGSSVLVNALPPNNVPAVDPRCFNEGAFDLPAPPSGFTYTWDDPVEGTSVLPADLQVGSNSVFVAIVESATQCRDSFPIEIEILPPPVADFTVPDFCFSDTAVFVNNSSPSTGVEYAWTFNDNGVEVNSTDESPTYTFLADADAPGTTTAFDVRLIVIAGGCQDTLDGQATMIVDGPGRSGIEWLGSDILVATDATAASYQWYKSCDGGAFVPINETSSATGENLGQRQFYHVADPTELNCKYLVETTNDAPGSCPTFSLPFNERRPAPLPEDFGLEIFPNPTQGEVTLSLYHPATGVASVQIFDRLGRQVWEQSRPKDNALQQESLDLSHLDAGVYFVAMNIGANHRFIQKMIIQ